ncbi:MAG: GH3 auxin-responsive promoter family protein [Oscillospiraceae bacterium]|nr:GH3 auxin-responsive promoter family protein [Oscillospiraceae bacterium]
MSAECSFLNHFCRLMYKPEYLRFMKKADICNIQNDYLMKLLKKNSATVYGKKYGFAQIHSYEEYSAHVPLTVYEDYEPYIEQMSKGQKNVLTYEDIILFELTSGSSGGKKLIPYTRSLRQEFQRGIMPWLYDIYSKVPGVMSGKSYWSITPVTSKKSYTECGIPVGFEEDAQYFGALVQSVMNRLFAVSSDVKISADMQDFYMKTAKQLIKCGSLSLISVWNPTFLTILCDFIRDNAGKLTDELDRCSAARLEKAVSENRFDILFPDLKIISMWADASAADYAGAVKERFPGIYIQPKGLLATECFVSFPLTGEVGSRLSIYSHFFEFRSLRDGKICTAAQLEKGEYEIIVTTGGGFYRYCIGDIVEILEVYKDSPPRMRFLRRQGITSDLFGEKLTEMFVRSVCTSLGVNSSFCLLAPCEDSYCLYTENRDITCENLDRALRESYHYDYCRSLGQLRAAKVRLVSGNPRNDYIRRNVSDGMRLGDIKPAYLSKKSGWDDWFEITEERTIQNA